MVSLASIPSRLFFLSRHGAVGKPRAFLKPSFNELNHLVLGRRPLGEISLRAATARQNEIIEDKLQPSTNVVENVEVEENLRIEKLVDEIREKFRHMNDGETSSSSYDTAWVARIPSADDPKKPQFQECIDWILENQNEDGSWGEPSFFLLYDRLVCTLACVLALKTWNIAEEQMSKGLDFLREHTRSLEDETARLRTSGFELVFPWMLGEARDLGLELPYDLPCVKKISTLREKKMKRIPVEVMHSVHTTMLYSLEALEEVVQWDKILKLQSRDGSFLSSPAATAVAYMKTGDKKCLQFLTKTVRRFHGYVPCQYPIDLFERIWAVDTIQRLGIDHLLRKEISDALYYVSRNIGKQGVSWGRDNTVPDVDDTCMALRLLRLHGYPVTPDILEYFKDDDGNILCFPGETHRGVSDMFNLYRLSQISFPGEKILKEAKQFTRHYLNTCLENNEIEDKWSLKKALGEEVNRALRYPWKTSLQRLEVREYIDQYGENDVWIAKTLYWLYNVNDPKYLELAKLEFNRLQSIYKEERISLLKWWNGCGLGDFAIEAGPEEIHSLISATLYDPEFSATRIAYTKCNCLENILKYLFENHESVHDLRILCRAAQEWNPSVLNTLPPVIKVAFKGMYDTLNELVKEASKAQGKDMSYYLHSLRWKQLQAYLKNREMRDEKHLELSREYIEVGKRDAGVAIRVLPSIFLIGDRLREFDLRCLDDRSCFHDTLSLYLTLINAKSLESIGNLITGATNRVTKEDNCNGAEVLETRLSDTIDDAFDELVHEYLKPGRVPRNSRRLMFEHGKIMQHLLSAKTDPANRSEMINTIAYLATPI